MTQRALRQCSKSTQKALREHLKRTQRARDQSDFAMPLEPKILVLVIYVFLIIVNSVHSCGEEEA